MATGTDLKTESVLHLLSEINHNLKIQNELLAKLQVATSSAYRHADQPKTARIHSTVNHDDQISRSASREETNLKEEDSIEQRTDDIAGYIRYKQSSPMDDAEMSRSIRPHRSNGRHLFQDIA